MPTLEASLIQLRQNVSHVPLLARYTDVTGINEMWNTFAPVPPTFASYLVVVAWDGGQDLTLWSEVPRQPFTTRGAFDPLTDKYLVLVRQPWNTAMQAAFLRYFADAYERRRGHLPERAALLEFIKDVPLGTGSIRDQPLVRRDVYQAPPW